MKRTIYKGMQILQEDTFISQHALVVEDQKIKAIIPEEMINHHLPADIHTYASSLYLVPGFIDMHIHGVAGFDVMDDSVEALAHMSDALATEGVTHFLATTMTAPIEKLSSVLTTVARAKDHCQGARILGVHLEGPFIAPVKMGAQKGDETLLPDASLIERWQADTNSIIKLITLAPELPGILPFIQTLKEQEIIISIGHTNATYDETMTAIHAGAHHATHLFNAMRGLHQREPGAVGALLLADNVLAELIVDGIHVHPAMVNLALKLKTKERLILITDAMRAKCLSEGVYELGGQQVSVKQNKVTLSDGTLAGSVLRMSDAIKNMMHFTKCDLACAIQMASFNPAKQLGLDKQKGSIAVGKDADLVLMDAAFNVLLTVREGTVIASAASSS